MRSSCPSCLTMIEHADGASEVTCSCGTKFSPYLDVPISEETPQSPDSPENSNATDFEESAAAFQDIRNFGETLGQAETTEAEGNIAPEPDSLSLEAPVGLELTPVVSSNQTIPNDALVTTSEKLDGYHIDQYFFPISIWFNVESTSDDPLRMALNTLWERANAQGANGLVAVRWTFTPDGIKGVLCGTPVHLVKEG